MSSKKPDKKDESPRVYHVGNFADIHKLSQVKRWNAVSRIARNSKKVAKP